MKYLKYVFPPILTACAIDPAAIDDYTGLGTSKLATRLRYSIFLGETAVDQAISDMVNVPQVLNALDPRTALVGLGFTCPAPPGAVCSYDGSAKSVITSADRNDTQKFTTKVHIQALLESRAIKIRGRVEKVNF
jgi:hypothetical protein